MTPFYVIADDSIGESPTSSAVGTTITISKNPIQKGTIVLKTADENNQKGISNTILLSKIVLTYKMYGLHFLCFYHFYPPTKRLRGYSDEPGTSIRLYVCL